MICKDNTCPKHEGDLWGGSSVGWARPHGIRSRIHVGEIDIWDDHEPEDPTGEQIEDQERRLDELISFIHDLCVDIEGHTGVIAAKAKELGLRVDGSNL